MIQLSSLLPIAFAEGSPVGSLLQFLPLLLIFGIFWFLLIAPMRKRQRALKEMLDELKKGDRVITTGGLHGEVASIKDGVLIVQLADNLKVKVSKSAVAGLQGSEE